MKVGATIETTEDIKLIADAVDSLIGAGQLTKKGKSSQKSETTGTAAEIYSNPNGLIFKYFTTVSDDDTMIQTNFYYNEDEKLKYVFITGSAANGSELEHEIYFSDEGERISELHRLTVGPGYNWPEKWKESDIVYDPLKDFNK